MVLSSGVAEAITVGLTLAMGVVTGRAVALASATGVGVSSVGTVVDIWQPVTITRKNPATNIITKPIR